MTVSAIDTFVRATGNGIATVFNFAFKVFDGTDLIVRDVIDTTQASTILILDTDYQVFASSTGEGGSVQLTTALPTGHTLDIRSVIPLQQPEDIRNQGRFLPELHEGIADRNARQIQDTRRVADASIRIPDGELLQSNWDTLLSNQTRKGKYLGYFNPDTGDLELFDSIGATTLSQSVIGSFLDQAFLGGFIYPRNAAEIAAAVVPTNIFNPDQPVIDARRYGYSLAASGATNTAALNNASLVCAQYGGGVIQLPPGAANLNGKINGVTNVYIRGHGSNSTILTQQHATDEVYLAVDTSYCGLMGLRAVPLGGDAIAWRATAADPLYFKLHDIYIPNVPSGKNGVWVDNTGAHAMYWPHFDQLYVGGGAYTSRTGVCFGGAGSSIVVGPTMIGGRIFNIGTGIDLFKVDTCRGFNVALDDCQGGSGIGIRFRSAAYCSFVDARMEAATFDKFLQFDAASADNKVSANFGAVPSAKITDAGINNDVYGSDGSGGFINTMKLPLALSAVKSLALTTAANSTAITWHRSFTTTYDPASIAANTTQETVISITGVLTTDSVFVCPQNGIEAGITVFGAPTTDGVRVVLANVTTGAINPASRTFTIDIWRH